MPDVVRTQLVVAGELCGAAAEGFVVTILIIAQVPLLRRSEARTLAAEHHKSQDLMHRVSCSCERSSSDLVAAKLHDILAEAAVFILA